VTALADHLKRLIEQNGPLTLATFMSEALSHPAHGYYVRHDPLGVAGDFVTAPEVSQVFGELIGLWLIDSWQEQSAPRSITVCELGPGRGTLMADVLRAAKSQPDFLDAIDIHLVEVSPALRDKQRVALASYKPRWHDSFNTVPRNKPLFLIANEFFDALPIRQFVRGTQGWHERSIGLDDTGRFAFGFTKGVIPSTLIPMSLREAPAGGVFELRLPAEALTTDIAERIANSGGAALIIDYGHSRHALGDTFQAVKGHAYANPLNAPGEADLTAHVDFEALGHAAMKSGARTFGPVEQGRFLELLGIHVRGARLAAANPDRRSDILARIKRLTAADQMGSLFKVLAVLPSTAPVPAGFERD
jgi:NADH dehydrogenase [ubiquinone] 1 alpha subcomplex assembly factor 7